MKMRADYVKKQGVARKAGYNSHLQMGRYVPLLILVVVLGHVKEVK